MSVLSKHRKSLVLIMDAAETAAWLKIPKSTLYKLCNEGEIPSAKIGRHWRFNKESLEKWLLSKTRVSCSRDKGKG